MRISLLRRAAAGIVALDKLGTLADESPCIRCARCMNACPMHLAPAAIDRAVRKDLFEAAEKLNALNCIECGACTFSCPAQAQPDPELSRGKARHHTTA